MNYPALLSFVCGFTSLSIEILWVRLYGFSQFSTPVAFGFVLMAYLLGIALGAYAGGVACRGQNSDEKLWRLSVLALILSAVLTLALPMVFGWLVLNGINDYLVVLTIMALASGVLAFVFPIAHHLGVGQHKDLQGRRFASVYTSNVMGAAIGPLITGYVLMDRFSLQQTFLVISLVQLVAAMLLGWMLLGQNYRKVCTGSSLVLALALAWTGQAIDPHGLIQLVNQRGEHAKTVIENRHGVITLFAGKNGDDAVFGGNVYDGRTNLNPEINSNGLQRPLLLAALQPEPKRVLMVGLSIGTWLALINEFPGVEQVDVVEINPGYLQAAQAYPAQARALRDPRVSIAVDDARRWLRLHPDRRYDLVIMNTTWHWRSNASLLLSAEFLRLVKSHMAPGAVMAFNATGSGDAFFTASSVFEHAYRYINFVYAADFDFRSRKDSPATRELYAKLRLGEQHFFAPGSKAIDNFIKEPFQTMAQAQKGFNRSLELITDQNMITEFKYGKRLN
jgi:spermidine synthase